MLWGLFGLSYKHLSALKTNPLNKPLCNGEYARTRHRALLPLLALLTGCSGLKMPDIPVPQFVTPYRMEIQQGNFVTQEMLSQLRPGMTRDQVRFVLGSPLVVDVFHPERWDYVFTRALEYNRGFEQRKVTVFFEEEKLKRIDGDVVVAPPAAGAPASPANTKEADKK